MYASPVRGQKALGVFIKGRAPCRKYDGWALPVTRRVKNKQKVSHSAQLNTRFGAGESVQMVRSFETRRVALIPRKPVGQRMVGPLAARGRDATAEADLAEALRRSRLTAQREKLKRAAADRRSFNVACTLSGLRAELDRREQRRQEAQYAEQLQPQRDGEAFCQWEKL